MRLSQLNGMDATQIANIIGCDAVRRSHLERFVSLPWPDKQSEPYRYADMERVWDRELTHLHPEPLTPRPSKSLVIRDGIVTEAPSGVGVRMINWSDVDAEHHDPLYYLGHALSERVIEVTLEEDSALTIEHHLHTPNALITYRIVLKSTPNTHTAVTERFVDAAGEGSVLLYGYDVRIPRDATLMFTHDQTLVADRYTTIASHAFDVDKGGTLMFGSFDFGSGHGLGQMRVVLGERAHVTAAHLLYADGQAQRGTVSHIVHRGAHSASRQIAKNILGDRARGIFDAIIRVESTAHHTQAHQNNKAILLESGAYMASKPQLEIYIDELEASHGSTTGQLDPKQMFYLRSRGISEHEARKMLILAFANEIIDSIAHANTREQLHASFEQAYYGQTHLECLETCHGCE